MTPPTAETMEVEVHGNDLAIIGAPVYSGRIPIDAVGRLRRLEAHGTPAVVVVVYGNREYEDALLELRDLAVEAGFKPVAGGAFLGEHSFSSEEKPIAHGRPDAEDIGKAREFGREIREKVEGMATPEDTQPVQVPGDFPYKERGELPVDRAPVTREDLCIKCGTCAGVCPKAAITVGETVDTDPPLCIFCTACVKNCPADARVWEHPWVLGATEWLYTNFSERKEPETYLQ
jgi:ferredoxin